MPFENVVDDKIVHEISVSHDVDHLAIFGDILKSFLDLLWNVEFGIKSTRQKVQNWSEVR